MGIALATAISAWVNTLLLFIILRIKSRLFLDNQLIINSFKIFISLIVMIGVCYFLNQYFFDNIADLSFYIKLSCLLLIIICCKIIYLVMIFMLKVLTIQDLKGYIKN